MNAEGEAYLKWFYAAGVWKEVSYRGVRTLKFPPDMWNYQEIICHYGIEWVIETGTRHGGSALFFADLLAAQESPGKVMTIDVQHNVLSEKTRAHPKIACILGDSGDAQLAQKTMRELPQERGKLLLFLDADHTAAHVSKELEAWVPLLKIEDYLIIEDTIINSHPVRPEFGPGPWEAVHSYLEAHPGMLKHDEAREEKFGATFAARGHYIKS